MISKDPSAFRAVYGSKGIPDRLLSALMVAGQDMDRLTAADLAPMDELHTMGRLATIELGKLARLKDHMHVLDIGSGLGGAARSLACEFGCKVTGIDITEDFCKAATLLTQRVGLGDRVEFRLGNALDLPFKAKQFDAAFMFHVNMNVADKKALFDEAYRVLRPGAVLALWEVCGSNSTTGFVFPVPWALDETMNFLCLPEAMEDFIKHSGFDPFYMHDATEDVIKWGTSCLAALDPRVLPPLSVDLVIENFHEKQTNAALNLIEGRIRILRILARRL